MAEDGTVVDAIRELFPPNPGATHYAGCWRSHRDCAARLAADLLEEAWAVIDAMEDGDENA